jgi:hypothetical protein
MRETELGSDLGMDRSNCSDHKPYSNSEQIFDFRHAEFSRSPYQGAGPLSAKLLKNGTLKTFKDYPHGMITTQADIINADLLAFIKS